MLLGMHVKNLALIDEMEIDFQRGLNILTGETGAGKSIILGSMNLALGEKVPKDLLKEDKDAYVELIFSLESEQTRKLLLEYELDFEEELVVFSRKISNGRSVGKINGISVPASTMRIIASSLIHIYGQQEHVTLLNKSKHLDILDAYGGSELVKLKKIVAQTYENYRQSKEQYDHAKLDETQRAREQDLLSYEVNELHQTHLVVDEDVDLDLEFRKMQGGQKILTSLGIVYEFSAQGEYNLSELYGKILKELQLVAGYDPKVEEIQEAFQEMDNSLADLNREISTYLQNVDFSQEHYVFISERLNTLNTMKNKYHGTISELILLKEEKEKRLDVLNDYDHYLEKLKNEFTFIEQELESCSLILSNKRKEISKIFINQIICEMKELNFLDVQLYMEFEKLEHYTKDGIDLPEFMISVNPGEPLKPLTKVASGGELSRMMLAIKSVLAEKEAIDTLIFDEIDAGISGRTAQMVSEKLYQIGRHSQVISITHLPQIAAMSDAHYLIEKSVEKDSTISKICLLNDEQAIQELARMLGGVEITETVVANAKEMIALAQIKK